MRYPGGGTSWSKPSSKPSYSSMTPNTNYNSYKSGWKSKSTMSKAKNVALLAGGAYVGYKLGKAVGSLGNWGHYNMMGYQYGPYYGHSYSPYYASPYMFSGSHYNRYAYRTSACYECSSVAGSNPFCESMDDKYSFSQLDSMRHVCPVESYCAVVVGRVYPKVEGPLPTITNETDPETLKQYEGKDFIRRVCQPVRRQQENKCDYCVADGKYEEKCDIYMCNVCDTESCNSWGASSMPDQRAYSSASTNHTSCMAFLALFLLNALL